MQEIKKYSDHRPAAKFRMNAVDVGMILPHGNGPNQCDYLGAREALIFEEEGVFHLFYDGAGAHGWVACLAVSTDLKQWEKRGTILDLGQQGQDDCAAACAPWVFKENGEWHMFYLGTPNTTAAPEYIPANPYQTLKAKAVSLGGPWVKQPEVVPFQVKSGTYYDETASPGHVFEHNGEYIQLISTAKSEGEKLCRTLSKARCNDLNGAWTVDNQPMLPVAEQIENSSLYYEESNRTWFLFTNHVGIEDGFEFTDSIWVYWTQDFEKWNPENKAIVLDGENCSWSKKCIGMPSVLKVGDRLALFYDAPGGDSVSHMNRDLGRAWLDLPLVPPDQ